VYPAAALAQCLGVCFGGVTSDASLMVAPLVIVSARTQLQYFSTSSVVSLRLLVWVEMRWHFGTGMNSFAGLGGGSVFFCIFFFIGDQTVVSKSALRMPLTPLLAEL